VIRSSSLLRTCSLVALCAIALGACATRGDEPARRVPSIKDDAADFEAKRPRVVRDHRVSHVVGPASREVTPAVRAPMERVEVKPAVDPAPKATSEPAPVLPKVEKAPPAVRVIVEAPVEPKEAPVATKPAAEAQPPVKTAILDPRPAPAKPAEVLPAVPEAPKTTVVSPESAVPAPTVRAPVVIKPAETVPTPAPSEARPTADVRRKPAPEAVTPPRNSAVPPVVVTQPPAVVAPANPQVAVVPPAPPAVVQPAQPPQKVDPKPEVKVEPKIAVLTEDQRVASVLASVDTYMKAGRFQSARLLLEDATKSGNPKLLAALAETYDPLTLREQYPKLSRTGDPEKAIALYEQAKAKGGVNLDARIAALKTLAGPKR
jgi:hypothetical protein